MEGAEREEISALRDRLQRVSFPYDSSGEADGDGEYSDGLHPAEVARREDALGVLARMLKTTVEQLKREQANDRMPDWSSGPEKEKTMNENVTDSKKTERVLASGWDAVDKAAASGGSWLKIAPGQDVFINVAGVPEQVEVTFEGDSPKVRYRVKVFVPGDGPKTWEMSKTTYVEQLRFEMDQCKHSIDAAVFKVRRVGDGMKTVYRMRYDRQLTAQEMSERGGSAPAAANDDNVPF
jgi:hypothetical protein